MAKKTEKAPARIAKRDFTIRRNDHLYEIKAGDDLDKIGVPEFYDQNLKTEKVL